MATVFVTGGTGYIGRAAIGALLLRGHTVKALVRAASVATLPAGAIAVIGNALDGRSFAQAVAAGDTFLQLVGTPHPGPRKAAEFERVDLVSVRESVRIAAHRGVDHFVYLSVAQPAPVMRAYVDVRRRGELALVASGLRHTVLRPWYVLGPGHRWPHLLRPLYWMGERIPSLRESSQRLGLVSLKQMVLAIVESIEHAPQSGRRVLEVPALRARSRAHADGELAKQ